MYILIVHATRSSSYSKCFSNRNWKMKIINRNILLMSKSGYRIGVWLYFHIDNKLIQIGATVLKQNECIASSDRIHCNTLLVRNETVTTDSVTNIHLQCKLKWTKAFTLTLTEEKKINTVTHMDVIRCIADRISRKRKWKLMANIHLCVLCIFANRLQPSDANTARDFLSN